MTQSSITYLHENKDIMQKWTGAEDFGNRFTIDNDRHWVIVISEMKVNVLGYILTLFLIFLI